MSGIEVAFFGALGRDAESKTSKAGKSYVRLNVRAGDGDGAQWISVMAFDEKAIEDAAKLVKGARIYVEGKLSLDEWTGQDGAKRTSLSVMSWHTRLAQIGRNRPSKKSSISVAAGTNDRPTRSASAAGDRDLNDEIPF
jgi:single-strand DNA-binding protein